LLENCYDSDRINFIHNLTVRIDQLSESVNYMLKYLTLSCLVFLVLTRPTILMAQDSPPLKASQRDMSLTNAVVKIFVTTNKMDYYRPWQSKGIKASGGSGAIIEGNRILTNAHVVSDQTFIQVKKDSDPKKYTARLVAIGHDCDLALLEVEDPIFFENIIPLKFGGLPKLQDSVTVMGYPMGGGKISITEGVVSRLEVTSYAQSSRRLLSVQIDAAINPGNSGGPVLKNGLLVGIAMQIFQAGQNIGYMIPTLIIEHFFEDLKDGRYEGFPMLGVDFKNTENATLREFYGITNEDGGVVISKVLPFSPAFHYLKEGDIILEINDVPIGEDGTFPFRGKERLSLTHLVTKERIGDDIELKIMRDQEILNVKVRLSSFVTLIPHTHYFKEPPYFIYGGLVFTVLSTDLTHSWGSRWWEKAPLDFIYYLIGTGRLNTQKRKEIVVLLNILPDDINVGYHGINNEVIETVNGTDIKSFKDFVLRVHEGKINEKFTILETEHKSQIILSNKGIDKVNEEILKRNSIPYQFSSDVGLWLKEAD